MYKNDDDWFNDLSNIFNKIDNQIQNTTQLDDISLASTIRELCEARDSGFVQFVYRNQICNMIDMLCTIYNVASCYLYKR